MDEQRFDTWTRAFADLAHGDASCAPWSGVARCLRPPAAVWLTPLRTMAWPDPAIRAGAMTNAWLPTRPWSATGTGTATARAAAPMRAATARMTPGAAGQTSALAARARASLPAARGRLCLLPGYVRPRPVRSGARLLPEHRHQRHMSSAIHLHWLRPPGRRLSPVLPARTNAVPKLHLRVLRGLRSLRVTEVGAKQEGPE